MELKMLKGETTWGYFCRYVHSQDVIGLRALQKSLEASDSRYIGDYHAKLAMVRTEIKMRKEGVTCRATK